MATTHRVIRREAARAARVAALVDTLVEYTETDRQMQQRLDDLRFEASCMAEALTRFRTDYGQDGAQ